MSESKIPAFDNKRKRAIREQIKKIMLNCTIAGARVFINRAIPTQVEDLPALLIYTLGESIRRFNEAPKDYERSMNVRIECIVAGDDDNDLDSKMEELGDKVEELMEVDETLNGLVDQLELSGTDYQVDPDAQSPVGVLALTYSVVFYTDAQNPKDDRNDTFEGVDAKWQVGHHAESSDEVTDAENTINVETGD